MQALAEHLGVVLVLDEPTTVSLVGAEQLETWGLEFEAALERAQINLRKRSDEAWSQLAPGLYGSPWSDYHDAARLCLPDLFHRLPLRGRPVTTVPNRHVILACGDRDEEALAALLEATRSMMDTDRPISAIPVRLEDSEWVSYAPDHEYPNQTGWAAMRAAEIEAAYSLQASLQKPDSSTASALVSVVPIDDGGHTRTGCFWPAGAPLLPSVDYVLLDEGPGPVPAIPLTTVQQQLPHLLERTDAWPPRWRALRRPTEDELAPLSPQTVVPRTSSAQTFR